MGDDIKKRMHKAEVVFNTSAKYNLIEWDLKSFKRSHPRLFVAIIAAMLTIQDNPELNKED